MAHGSFPVDAARDRFRFCHKNLNVLHEWHRANSKSEKKVFWKKNLIESISIDNKERAPTRN